jgi:hypothetical protein
MNICIILWYGNPLEGKDGSDRITLKLITEKQDMNGIKILQNYGQ